MILFIHISTEELLGLNNNLVINKCAGKNEIFFYQIEIISHYNTR